MQKLYYFNPDSDLALANNDPNFMSPQAIRWLKHDLSLLPIWYAEKGSWVLVSDDADKAYYDYLSTIFNLEVNLFTVEELCATDLDFELIPWGWNLAVRRQFERYGFSESQLKSVVQIDSIREFSSRQWVPSILDELPNYPQVCGESRVLKSFDDLLVVDQDYKRFLMKAPFSGSGRGLKWCRNGLDQASIRWFENTLKQQQIVIAEPIYNRVKDFAMEFEITDFNEIEFIGYSYFKTTDNGVYLGNYLIDDTHFESYIEKKYFDIGFLLNIRNALMKALLGCYGETYRGVLGVDMMVCRSSEDTFMLHPCVEVNLRMNMGIVVKCFYNRIVMSGKTGRYAVDFYKSKGEALALHFERQKNYPLHIEEGKVVSGYLSLSAITTASLSQAWVIVE